MEKDQNTNAIKNRSKEYASQFWKLIRIQVEKSSNQEDPAKPPPAPPKQSIKYQWILNFLFIIPYVLTIVFLISFFWDFNGLSTTIFGKVFNFEGLLRM